MASAVVHFLDVGHGDSSVIRITSANGQVLWVLVDTNTVRRDGAVHCPAYDFLCSQGVAAIDLLVVTHLHADHYRGIEQILDRFEVRRLIIPPILSLNSKLHKDVFKKYRAKIREVAKRAGDASPEINAELVGLARLLNFVVSNPSLVEEGAGPWSVVLGAGSQGAQLVVLLPVKRMKGTLIQRITDGKFELNEFPHMNDASVVLLLEIEGRKILLGADSTIPHWREHRAQMLRQSVDSLDASVVRAPHHGSAENNEAWIYKYAMGEPRGRDVVVSADGISHPHEEFFQIVSDLKLAPHCTNLASNCVGTDLWSIEELAQLPVPTRPFLINYHSHERPSPCQGDISVSLSSSGIRVSSATNAPCVYNLPTKA